jgi:phage baseplate assembly protein V
MEYLDHGILNKFWWRLHHTVRRITVNTSDDTGQYQTLQTTGFPGEVRDGIPNVQNYGFSSNPLPGAEGVTVATSAGYQGLGTVIAVNDSRPNYRPTHQKPGEICAFMVDGADSSGNNGTLRSILKGAIGWLVTLTGKTITLGDASAQTINIGTTATSVTINVGESSNCTLNVKGSSITINGQTGDCTINGISLVHHVHSGVQPGDGDTGPPVSS